MIDVIQLVICLGLIFLLAYLYWTKETSSRITFKEVYFSLVLALTAVALISQIITIKRLSSKHPCPTLEKVENVYRIK